MSQVIAMGCDNDSASCAGTTIARAALASACSAAELRYAPASVPPHWHAHLFWLLANKPEMGFDQMARAGIPVLFHRIPFLYLTKLFVHSHAQLRNKTFIDRAGRIPVATTTTQQAGAAVCWTHAGVRSVVHPRSTIALRIEETGPIVNCRYRSLLPSLGDPRA